MGVSNQGILKCVPKWCELGGTTVSVHDSGTFIVYLFLYTTYSCVLDGSMTTVD